MAFNLKEYILFRTEIKRELTNAEVDTNFQMVSNPWVTTRTYEEGNIVYHPVIVDDPTTTAEDTVLAWWRANKRTTRGTFVTTEWDIIGGIGSGTLNLQGADSFGKINVNSTAATGALQTGTNALLQASIPNDTFNFTFKYFDTRDNIWKSIEKTTFTTNSNSVMTQYYRSYFAEEISSMSG